MSTLVLLRHGQSLYNKENLFTGWTDIDLSDEGKIEAQNAGRILEKHKLYPDICFTSWLKRAIHTAQITLKEMLWEHVDCHKSWQLNERHYGAWQQHNKDAILKEVGKEMFVAVRRGFLQAPPSLQPNDPRVPYFDPKYHSLEETLLPLGESLQQTQVRTLNYYYKEIAPALSMGKTVLVSAHGNSLRALVKMLEKVDDEAIANVEIPTGVPIVYEFDEMLSLISVKHLNE